MGIRTIAKRASAGGLAVLFLLAGNLEGYGLRDCPHHEHLGGHHPAHVDEDAASTEGLHRPSHASAMAPSGSADEEHEDAAPCSCLGACHASAAAPLGSVPGGAALAPPSAHRWASESAESDRIFFTTPYLLPFPNAPPSVHVSTSS